MLIQRIKKSLYKLNTLVEIRKAKRRARSWKLWRSPPQNPQKVEQKIDAK